MPQTKEFDIAVIGGGAAGYFAALRAGELAPSARICIFEAGKRPLEKVRVSGGGRCNVTHHCFDPARLVLGYPRGSKELRGPFHRFQPQDTVAWFAERGVQLKAEDDGRMFPDTDASETIINCLEAERKKVGVVLQCQSKISKVSGLSGGGFELRIERFAAQSEIRTCRMLMIATGSNKSGYAMAAACGHRISDLVPSLFTFTIKDSGLTSLAGVSVPDADLTLEIEGREISRQRGPLLITHWGLSGPAVLKLSAFAARELHGSNYRGIVRIDFTGGLSSEQMRAELAKMRSTAPRKLLLNNPLFEIPSRLWEYLLRRGLPTDCERPWAEAGKSALTSLAAAITGAEFAIAGKGQFKDEFVTCGGVATEEVDFRTMESKRCSELFLAGEILDIDGITGGYNFQNAWTTGWLAGSAMGGRVKR